MKALALLMALTMASAVPTFAEEAATEVPTITVGAKFQSEVEDYETNLYTKHIEESLGVNLDFVVYNDMGNQLALQVMSGEELPDVINYPLDVNTTWKYVQAGAFRCLTSYYEDPAFNANLVAAQEIVPGYLDYVRCPDGNYYSIPCYQREMHSEVNNKMWVNTHWLEELGLDTPTTLDEFHDMLVAFKENYPDCYPCLGSSTSVQGDLILWIMNAFIYDDGGDHLNVDADGNLSAAYVTDQWKQALIYVRQLVDEGLYDVSCFTMDRGTTMTPILRNEEKCLVGCFLNSANNLMTKDTPWWTWFDGLEPLTGPEGVSYTRYGQSIAYNYWFVTKDCPEELVDLAVSIGIFIHDPTEYEFILDRYGEEGVDWLEPTTSEAVYEGFDAMYEQVNDMWSVVQNKTWRKQTCIFAYKADQAAMETGDPNDWIHKIPQAVAKYYPHIPKEGEYVPTLLYTTDELDQISEKRSNINTYVRESRVLFVTREMSIEDDWDSYVQQCWDMGLQEFLDVAQTVYDRQVKGE